MSTSIACSTAEPAPVMATDDPPPMSHVAPPPPALAAPACTEVEGLAWPRAAVGRDGVARSNGNGALVQKMHGGETRELAFLGGHTFDLLNKLSQEADNDDERRRVVCNVLNDAASRGVKVLRLWGTLKRTGSSAEVNESVRILSLVLDENARRQHPQRFIVTLLNHQAGYGQPDPTRSLDDQAPGPWRADAIYTRRGWQTRGVGSLGERIMRLAAETQMASQYVIAWELVNELDTFRHVAHGSFAGPEARALRDEFLVPAASLLAAALPQPIMLGDIRGHREPYAEWAPSVIAALPPWVRARLVWTTHVYDERGSDPNQFLRKLDVDLRLARDSHLPFVVGELGQHVPGSTHRFCGQGATHQLGPLFDAVRRRGVRAVLVWGEGRCRLRVGRARTMIMGAGSDSAEISEADHRTGELLVALRKAWP